MKLFACKTDCFLVTVLIKFSERIFLKPDWGCQIWVQFPILPLKRCVTLVSLLCLICRMERWGWWWWEQCTPCRIFVKIKWSQACVSSKQSAWPTVTCLVNDIFLCDLRFGHLETLFFVSCPSLLPPLPSSASLPVIWHPLSNGENKNTPNHLLRQE